MTFTLNIRTADDRAAAALAEARRATRIDRATFVIGALQAGLITPADAEIAAVGEWPPGFDAFLAGLDPVARIAAKAAWCDAFTISRNHPLIAQIGAALSLTDAHLDALFGIAGA